jgi:hypothetical protein
MYGVQGLERLQSVERVFSLAVVDAGHIVKSTGWCTKPLETLWSLDNSGTQTQKELREIHYQ